MLPQQIIAILIALFFIFKLHQQKKKAKISQNEFVFWLFFWGLAALAIAFIKQIDLLVAKLGLAASGISFLLYLAVIFLFYFVFRLRLNIAKLDRELTELTRTITIKEGKEKQEQK
jgi:hypothetical protein